MYEQYPTKLERHDHSPQTGELYSDLHDLYRMQAVETAQEIAARASVGAAPNIAKLLDAEEFPADIKAGTKADAHSRIEHAILTKVAEKEGINISYGNELPNDGDNHLVWEIGGINGAVSFRYRDIGGRLQDGLRKDEEAFRQPFSALERQIKDGAQSAITGEYFALDEEGRDLVMSFMRLDPKDQNEYRAKAKFVEALYDLPIKLDDNHMPNEGMSGVYFNPQGELTKILHEIHAGVAVGMYFDEGTRVDPSDTSFRLGVEIDPMRAALERSYGGKILSPPFIESITGKTFIDTLDAGGLRPSSELIELLTGDSMPGSSYDARYGNRYSELTRTIAKYVGDPDRAIGLLFEGEEQEVRDALMEIDVSEVDNQPVRFALKILQQSVNPDRDLASSTMPIHEGSIKIKSDSCKDAEIYFLDAFVEGKVSYHETSAGLMAHKHIGGKTAINLSPVLYKGVEIPAGGLFQRHINPKTDVEEYAFVRLTSFAFDTQAASDAFGWQYTETINEYGQASAEDMKRFTSSSLSGEAV